jgi:hypothetical protein
LDKATIKNLLEHVKKILPKICFVNSYIPCNENSHSMPFIPLKKEKCRRCDGQWQQLIYELFALREQQTKRQHAGM